MGRLTIVDGFRGFFLLFMAIVHFDGILRTSLASFTHHQFGWVEDAQGFVFISGVVVGIVYGRKYLRDPRVTAIFRPILARIRTIYSHQAALIAMMLAAGLTMGAALPEGLEPFQSDPFAFTAVSLALVAAVGHMGILPMYIFFLFAVPYAFRAIDRGYMPVFVLVSVLLWLAAQLEIVEMLALGAQDLVAMLGFNVRFGIYFNAFAWQVLFFTGLYFGFRHAQGRLDLASLRGPVMRLTFLIAFAAVIALGIFDRVVEWELLGPDYTGAVFSRTSRSALSFIYVVAFALDAFVVVWLLAAGAEDRARWIRGLSALLAWVFTRRILVFLGQHSLHVFSLHIIVYYVLATIVPPADLPLATRVAAMAGAIAILYLGAWGHAWLQARDRAQAVAASGARG